MSPLVIFPALPAFAVAALRWWRRRDRVSAAVVAWCGGTFGTLAIISLSHPSNYIYYMVVVVPGLALALAALLASPRLHRLVPWGYALASIVTFVASYPFRVFEFG